MLQLTESRMHGQLEEWSGKRKHSFHISTEPKLMTAYAKVSLYLSGSLTDMWSLSLGLTVVKQ